MTGYLRRLAERATGAGSRPAVEPVFRRFEPEPEVFAPEVLPAMPPVVLPVKREHPRLEPEADRSTPPILPAATPPQAKDPSTRIDRPRVDSELKTPVAEMPDRGEQTVGQMEPPEIVETLPPRRTYLEPPPELVSLAPRRIGVADDDALEGGAPRTGSAAPTPTSAARQAPPEPPSIRSTPEHTRDPSPPPPAKPETDRTTPPPTPAYRPTPARLEPARPAEQPLPPLAPDLHIGRVEITVAEPPAPPKPQPIRRPRAPQAGASVPRRRAAGSGPV